MTYDILMLSQKPSTHNVKILSHLFKVKNAFKSARWRKLMITRTLFLSTILINALILTGCSNLDTNKPKKTTIYQNYVTEKKLEPLDRITSFSFQGWRSLDNYHFILNTSPTRHYLIQLNSYCADLRFATSIIINNDGNSLHSKFDSIHVAEGLSTKRSGIKCIIKSIYKITKKQSNEIAKLKKAKVKDKDDKN